MALKGPSFSYRFADQPSVKWGELVSELVPPGGGLGISLTFSWWCSSLMSPYSRWSSEGTPRLLADPSPSPRYSETPVFKIRSLRYTAPQGENVIVSNIPMFL